MYSFGPFAIVSINNFTITNNCEINLIELQCKKKIKTKKEKDDDPFNKNPQTQAYTHPLLRSQRKDFIRFIVCLRIFYTIFLFFFFIFVPLKYEKRQPNKNKKEKKAKNNNAKKKKKKKSNAY